MNRRNPSARNARLLLVLFALPAVSTVGCSASPRVDRASAEATTGTNTPAEPEVPVISVVPGDGCPDVEPDLTTVLGAEVDDSGLRIHVRTTTFCDEHVFAIHPCAQSDQATTYRVSETNDCELPNDGVLEHVLVVGPQHLGDDGQVQSFDAETVTVVRPPQ